MCFDSDSGRIESTSDHASFMIFFAVFFAYSIDLYLVSIANASFISCSSLVCLFRISVSFFLSVSHALFRAWITMRVLFPSWMSFPNDLPNLSRLLVVMSSMSSCIWKPMPMDSANLLIFCSCSCVPDDTITASLAASLASVPVLYAHICRYCSIVTFSFFPWCHQMSMAWPSERFIISWMYAS